LYLYKAEVQRLAKGFELAMTRTKNYVALTKQMYWKPPFMEKTVQAMEELSRSHCKLRICRCVAMRLVQWPNMMY
jgi:hypothetical protein